MAVADDIWTELNTLRIKLETYDAFVTDECMEELAGLFDNRKAAKSFADKLNHYLPHFKENPTSFFNQKEILERPTLGKDLKKKKKGSSDICCYKNIKSGKNNGNVRCIFIMEGKVIVFLTAFVEKDKKDYEIPLKRAVNRYNEIYEGD